MTTPIPDPFSDDENAIVVTDVSSQQVNVAAPMGVLGPYLPLAGGTMRDGADITMGTDGIIQFPNVTAPKIHLYSNTFGLGIESGSATVFASSTVRFRQNSMTGTQWAYIDGTCGGGRVLTDATALTESESNSRYSPTAHTHPAAPASLPDSKATVTVTGGTVRAGQNFILYNDAVVCWYVSLTPSSLWEGSWKVFVNADGYPSNLRPPVLIEQWHAAPNGTHNATSIAMGFQIETSGVVSAWKPADGPDIETTTVLNFGFVYPRNY